MNDGLVRTFLLALLSGVAGGRLSTTDILLTAISDSLAAGSVSIFAGEYMTTKSQDEVLEVEIKLEKSHIRNYHEEEVNELEKPTDFDWYTWRL